MPTKYVHSVEEVIAAVSEYLSIPIDVMTAPNHRTGPVLYARQLAQYLACTTTFKSKQHIGEQFNHKDHTPVLYNYNKIALLVQRDQKVQTDVKLLKAKLGV